MKGPKLERVIKLARASDPPVSSEVLLRKLRKLEKATGKKIIYGGGSSGCPWEADTTFLTKLNGSGDAKNLWARFRALEQQVTGLTTELAEIHTKLAEHGIL